MAMTKEHANELKVGIVVIICLVLGIGTALKLSNWQSWFETKNTLTFKVPYRAGIGGIKAGWPVTIGGVSVGSVEEVWLNTEPVDPRDVPEEPPTQEPPAVTEQLEQVEQAEPAEQVKQAEPAEQVKQAEPAEQVEQAEPAEQVEQAEPAEEVKQAEAISSPTPDHGLKTYSYFRFTLPTKYGLREDCCLKPASQPIGGAGEVMITDLGTGKMLGDGQIIFRKKLGGTNIDTVMETVQEAVENVRKITEDFKDVSAKARVTVNETKPKLETIVGNIQTASDNFKDLSAKAKETVELSKPKLEVTVDNIQTASGNFKDLSAKAKETIILTKPQLEKIVANIRAASAEMKEGIREIRWNPWRLLHDPTDRELRTQNLLAAARAFSTGASDIDASVSRLEGLLEAKGDQVTSDDPEVQQMLEQLRATMVKFNEAADAFFKRLGTGK